MRRWPKRFARPSQPEAYPRPGRSRVLLIEAETDHGLMTGKLEVVATRGVDGEVPSGALEPQHALAWARGVADVVVVQAGGKQFSAGRLPEPNCSTWDDGWQLRVGRQSYEPPGPVLDLYVVGIWSTGGAIDAGRLASIERAPGVVRVVREDRNTAAVYVSRSAVATVTDEPLFQYIADVNYFGEGTEERAGWRAFFSSPRSVSFSVRGPASGSEG